MNDIASPSGENALTYHARVLPKNLTAHQRGLIVLAGAAACVLVNLFDLRTAGMYFTLLFPFAFAVAPVGVVLLLFGKGTDPTGQLPRPAARLMLALMVVGAFLGLAANHAVSH